MQLEEALKHYEISTSNVFDYEKFIHKIYEDHKVEVDQLKTEIKQLKNKVESDGYNVTYDHYLVEAKHFDPETKVLGVANVERVIEEAYAMGYDDCVSSNT